jgi:hypothetical protein
VSHWVERLAKRLGYNLDAVVTIRPRTSTNVSPDNHTDVAIIDSVLNGSRHVNDLASVPCISTHHIAYETDDHVTATIRCLLERVLDIQAMPKKNAIEQLCMFATDEEQKDK